MSLSLSWRGQTPSSKGPGRGNWVRSKGVLPAGLLHNSLSLCRLRPTLPCWWWGCSGVPREVRRALWGASQWGQQLELEDMPASNVFPVKGRKQTNPTRKKWLRGLSLLRARTKEPGPHLFSDSASSPSETIKEPFLKLWMRKEGTP